LKRRNSITLAASTALRKCAHYSFKDFTGKHYLNLI